MPRILIFLVLLGTLAGCKTSYQQAARRNAGPISSARESLLARGSSDRTDSAGDSSSAGRSSDNEVAHQAAPTETEKLTAGDAGDKADVQTVAFDEADEAATPTPARTDTTAEVETPQADMPYAGAAVAEYDDTGRSDAPLDPRREYPINLSTTLALVAGQNPQVQFAQWRIEEAYAQLDGAEALWLPSIQAGINYRRHDGTYQASDGSIVDVNLSSVNAGLGAGAVAAGTIPNPGIVARFHTTDAVFAPRIAELTAAARTHGAKATLNDQLLRAALAYLETLNAAQDLAISLETFQNTSTLAELTSDFAETGQGLQSDADRMAAELAVRNNDLIRAEEAIAVASVRLAEVASFDLDARLVPVEPAIVPIELVSVDMDQQSLMALGLRNRPELHEARTLVAEACERLQREKYAPLLPSVLLGFSYGGFGGGQGGHLGNMHDRVDFDALAVWEVRNLGIGERAARDTARSRIEQRRWEQVRLMDRVAREVAEAAAQVESRRRQMDASQEAIEISRLSYERNLNRIRQGQGLPIEALQSVQALNVAQREYLRAVVSYNEAQFRLHRALGWPVTGHHM